jgi:acetyl esterase/lipase
MLQPTAMSVVEHGTRRRRAVFGCRLLRRRRTVRACAALVALLAVLAACAHSEDGKQQTVPRTLASALPDGPCHDNQPGRYVDEIFEADQLRTMTFATGLDVDIYGPANDPATCRVGIVWVHGGGFTEGTRNGDAEHAWGTAMARRGYTLASIDYRLTTGAQFSLDGATDPARTAAVANAIADVQTAVRWVRASARSLRVDPRRVAVGGTSAGAMTALGAALTATSAEKVCTVVSVSGEILERWVGHDPPPVLFIHGRNDVLVSYLSAQVAIKWLTDAGGRTMLVTIPDAGHEITGVPRPEMVTSAAGWLRDHAATTT